MMKIFQLDISAYSQPDFFQQLTEKIKYFTPWEKWLAVFTPNPEICLKTLQDTEFLNILQRGDMLLNDGIGLYLAYQIADSWFWKIGTLFLLPYYFWNILCCKPMLYQKYGDRICGSDATKDIIQYAQEQQIKIVILDLYNPDDTTKVASQKVFEQKLQEVFPKLEFEYYIFNPEKQDQIFKDISHSDAKVVFTTLWMKKQEQLVLETLDRCPNIAIWMGVGSSFDYFIGYQKRAPEWMRAIGIEWLYRIFTSPGKLKRLGRIYKAVIVFPIKVILYK